MHTDLSELSDNPTQESIELLIGRELMTKLSDDLGGKMLFIPSIVGENSPLAVSIGLKAAKEISKIYGGSTWGVPVIPGRQHRVIKLYLDKTPKAEIAAKLKMPRRTVYRIIDSYEMNKQPTLI